MSTTFNKICTFFTLLLLSIPVYAGDIISKATVTYITLEGGFYGLQTQSGQRYIPSNLAAQFKKHGLAVHITAKKQVGRLGIHMWGEYIDIINIRALPCQPTVGKVPPPKRRKLLISPVFPDALSHTTTSEKPTTLKTESVK